MPLITCFRLGSFSGRDQSGGSVVVVVEVVLVLVVLVKVVVVVDVWVLVSVVVVTVVDVVDVTVNVVEVVVLVTQSGRPNAIHAASQAPWETASNHGADHRPELGASPELLSG